MFNDHERSAPIDIRRPPMPATIRAAGWTWVAIGTLLLLHIPAAIVVAVVSIEMGAGESTFDSVGLILGVFPSLFGLLFLYFGVVSLRGLVSGMIVNGTGSWHVGALFILFAGFIFLLLAAAPREDPQVGPLTPAVIGFWLLCGVASLRAGRWAYAGHDAYQHWLRLDREARQRREQAERYHPLLGRRRDLPEPAFSIGLSASGNDAGEFYSSERPWMVRLAGILWVVIGFLMLVSLIVQFIMLFAVLPSHPSEESSFQETLALTLFVLAAGGCSMFGVVFISVGQQTLRGEARGMIENGIGSLIFSAVYGVIGKLLLLGDQFAAGGLPALLALGLFATGVLALAGSGQYRKWRRAKMMRREPTLRHDEDERQSFRAI